MNRSDKVGLAVVGFVADVVTASPTRVDVDRVHECVVRSRTDVTRDRDDVFTGGHTTGRKQVLQLAELNVFDTGTTV